MTSPSTLTLAAVRSSSIANIAGVCVTSSAFLGQLNEAVSRLMDAGDWWNTVVKARLCVQRDCIAWPRWVGTVLAINFCNQNRPIQNRWFDFMPITASDCMLSGRWKSNVTVVDDGLTPVFNNVACGESHALRAYVRLQADAGKTITFFGKDENGQEVMTKDALGNWMQGETVALAAPYVQTTTQFREVERVIRDQTTGPVDVYQYDATQNLLLDMAHYEPTETNPMYRHSTIRGGCGSRSARTCYSADGSKARKVEILAKLQFIPVVVDTDTVQIDNVPALKLMIQAIRLEEAGNDQEAASKQLLAIKELNRQLRNKLPLDQIPIEVASNGTALPRYHGIGQMQ